MKKAYKSTVMLTTALASFGMSYTSVAAATTSTAESTGTIRFIQGDDPNTPLNPTDPDKPNETDPDDPNNNGTGNVGPLTIDYVSNINFGKAKVNNGIMDLKALNKTPYVQIKDSREKASGWTLVAAMTKPFTHVDNDSTLKGAVMNWNNGEVKAPSWNNSGKPEGDDFSLTADGTASTVMSAKAGKNQGSGIWLDVFADKDAAEAKGQPEEQLGNNSKVTLKVPSSEIQNGLYNAELTWTLTDTPG